jgi:4-hydroxythreonine-4-phosphate dehydrogenase
VADARPAEELAAPVRGALAVRSLAQVGALTAAVPAGRRLAVITGPIDKHACVLAGFAHGGQTEYFEELWGAPAVMTLAGSRLRVGLVTNHLPLKDVPKALTAGTVLAKLALFVRTLREAFGCKRPRVAVCGVNPHAGDGGLFGDEESRCLAPALAAFKGDADVTGPVPADTAFYRAYHGAFDGVLAMYHDQGLGPLKTVHFDDAVNLSGGLPHFRASPDHGPARDLFLRKAASPASFALTLDLAAAYLRGGFR